MGGPGNDAVLGGKGSDRAVGESGRDFIEGHRSSDQVVGEGGDDFLVDGPLRETARDILSGGDGDDVLQADNRPAARDVVSCGDGFDRVAADRKDLLADGCEEVAIGPAAAREFFEELEEEEFFESFFAGLAPSPFPE